MRADFFGQQKGDVITPARETLKGPALLVNICVGIKFYGAFTRRADACSMAWRCRFLTARRGQDGRVIAEK